MMWRMRKRRGEGEEDKIEGKNELNSFLLSNVSRHVASQWRV
jgi:hypothetical protein